MSAWPWVGVVVAGVALFGGLGLLGYGLWQTATAEQEGRHWSQEALYECELAPSCDEAAAAEEARLWRETDFDVVAFMGPGFILVVAGAVVGGPSLSAIPRVQRWVQGGSS